MTIHELKNFPLEAKKSKIMFWSQGFDSSKNFSTILSYDFDKTKD